MTLVLGKRKGAKDGVGRLRGTGVLRFVWSGVWLITLMESW